MSAPKVRLFTARGVRFAIGSPDLLGVVVHADAPRTTREVVTELGTRALVVVDGAMFEFCRGERERTYERFSCGTPRFRHYYPARGIDVPSLEPSRGVSIYVAGGMAGGEDGAGTQKANETFRVQAYPALIADGRPQRVSDVDKNKRPAVGVLSSGEVFLALGQYITMPELVDVLATTNLGTTEHPVMVRWAGYLDGGGSAAMYVDVDPDGRPEYAFNTGGRRVISWVTMEDKASTIGHVSSVALNALKRVMSFDLHDPIFVMSSVATTAALLLFAFSLTSKD